MAVINREWCIDHKIYLCICAVYFVSVISLIRIKRMWFIYQYFSSSCYQTIQVDMETPLVVSGKRIEAREISHSYRDMYCILMLLVSCRFTKFEIWKYRKMIIILITVWHDDVIKWKHFPRDWHFVRWIHRSPVNPPHGGQWRGALRFSLVCARINSWINNREAGDLRRHRAHYDVIVTWHWNMPQSRDTDMTWTFMVSFNIDELLRHCWMSHVRHCST